MPEMQDERLTARLKHQRMIKMTSRVLVSIRGDLTHLTFTDPAKAEGYCAKMDRLGIEYTKEVF